jgi:hypothetical protein
MLLHCDLDQRFLTSEAGLQSFILEAGLFRCAAISKTVNLTHLIHPGIIFFVESGIANWFWWIFAGLAHWKLVVNIEVLGATRFVFSIHSTTMFCEHCVAIGIAFELTISKVEFIMLGTLLVTSHIHRVDTSNFRPMTIVINLWTNLGAILVILLTCFANAVIRATLCEEFFLGVVMEQDINVAFNLLGGRPVDLAVLLQTLFFFNELSIGSPTGSLTLIVICVASLRFASVVFTTAFLKLLLLYIALHVHRQEGMVRLLAHSIEF